MKCWICKKTEKEINDNFDIDEEFRDIDYKWIDLFEDFDIEDFSDKIRSEMYVCPICKRIIEKIASDQVCNDLNVDDKTGWDTKMREDCFPDIVFKQDLKWLK